MADELKKIKKASFVRRIIALIMDGAVTIFAFFAFFTFVFSPIATYGFKYKEILKEGSKIQLSSHLYVVSSKNEERNIPITDSDEEDINFYVERIKYYYLTYKTTIAPDCNEKIMDDSGVEYLPQEYYTPERVDSFVKDIATVEDAKKVSYDALIDFSKYIKDVNRRVKLCESFMIFPSFILSFGIFYILVPLLYKNGETFGKKVMRLALVTKDGYEVRKRQIVTRQLFLFVYVAFFAFFFAIGIASFALLGLGVAIYFIAAFISKTNRSFADYLAYTYLVDANSSVWFKDEIEEKQKEEIIEKNLEKYNKKRELDKHIIQVGSTVIEEHLVDEKEEKTSEN